jgi:hypothetical protein
MGRLKNFLLKSLWQDPNYEVDQVSCDEITIEDVDPILYAHLLTEATTAGAKFDGTKASIQGLEFDWTYDEAAQVLHVTCTKKPFYATCSEVESRIKELVTKAKGAI